MREDAITTVAKALAPQHHRDAGKQADGNAAGGADPAVLEGVLQKIGNPYQHGSDADAVQPVRADARFETGCFRLAALYLLGKCPSWFQFTTSSKIANP